MLLSPSRTAVCVSGYHTGNVSCTVVSCPHPFCSLAGWPVKSYYNNQSYLSHPLSHSSTTPSSRLVLFFFALSSVRAPRSYSGSMSPYASSLKKKISSLSSVLIYSSHYTCSLCQPSMFPSLQCLILLGNVTFRVDLCSYTRIICKLKLAPDR